ncbi:MAG TPA: hypothetical protein VD839_11705 [Burkholderiales bacterium]|nr:hypothetical protein [Burkholderiales bacterium]
MFRIKEVADVFVDACVRDEEGRLLFLSCFGRDTAIQQLFAAFYLKLTEGGLEVFHLAEPSAGAHAAGEAVRVRTAEALQKLAGRLPRENVFGNLAHTWIYDPVIVRPDRATRTAWVLDPAHDAETKPDAVLSRVWEVFKLLSPVPLLDEWQPTLMKACFDDCVKAMADSAFPPLGRVSAQKVIVPDSFLGTVSTLVKRGELALSKLKQAA